MGTQTRVDIDFSQLGISWNKNTQYRIALEEDFVKEDGGEEQPNPATSNLLTFTTNATGPVITSTAPVAGTTLTNTTSIIFNYDRKISINSGQIHLYKAGSPNQLVHSFNVNDPEVTLGSNQSSVEVDLVDYISDGNSEYYYLIDPFLVVDTDEFYSDEVTNTALYRYTTGSLLRFSPVPASTTATRITPGQYSNTGAEPTFSANIGDVIVYFVTANNDINTGEPDALITPSGYTNFINLTTGNVANAQRTAGFYQISTTTGSRTLSSFGPGTRNSTYAVTVYRPVGTVTSVSFNTLASQLPSDSTRPTAQTLDFSQMSGLSVAFAYGSNSFGATGTSPRLLTSSTAPTAIIEESGITGQEKHHMVLNTFVGNSFTGTSTITAAPGLAGCTAMFTTIMTVS